MFTAYVENHKGERLRLSQNPAYSVTIDGLLSPQVTISKTTATNKDGSNATNVRAEDRIIDIEIQPRYPVELNRQQLYKYFPIKKTVTFYFANENRAVKIDGIVQQVDGNLFEQTQTISIVIDCLQPFFVDQNETLVNMSQVIGMFEFPFAIKEEGIEFSVLNQELSQMVANTGDVDTGVVIRMEAMGTVVNPIIYNVDTKEYFGLDITMQPGDAIEIDTTVGEKKVTLIREGQRSNILNNIIAGNTWFTLEPGENLFTYTADDSPDLLFISFHYSLRFEGV